jgi:AraC-like DNA-binding protein
LAVDVLSDVLRVARVGEPRSALSEGRAPWGLRFDGSLRTSFHMLLEGTCWLVVEQDGVAPLRLVQGDVVLLPEDPPHVLADEVDSPHRDFGSLAARVSGPVGSPVRVGGDGARTSVLSGAYALDLGPGHPVLAALPPVVHVTSAPHGAQAIAGAVALLAGELDRRPPGFEAAIPRLVDLMFLYVLRAWAQRPGSGGDRFFGALTQPEIGAALLLIHESPGRRWTVADLAGEVGLSRSAFAHRFTGAVGVAPLAYLSAWRMTIAAELLRTTSMRLAAIAREVGYDSEFAFAAAFKRIRGQAPGRYRSAHHEKTGP